MLSILALSLLLYVCEHNFITCVKNIYYKFIKKYYELLFCQFNENTEDYDKLIDIATGDAPMLLFVGKIQYNNFREGHV